MRIDDLGTSAIGIVLAISGCVGDGPAVAAPQVSVPQVQLRPVDEAREDSVFMKYREGLLQALADRDVERVLGVMAEPLREQKKWLWTSLPKDRLGKPGSPWDELVVLLRLGGTFTTTRGVVRGRREFCAPYVYSAYPFPLPDHLNDPYFPSVILGSEVAVHQEMDAASVVIARLSYEIVPAGGLLGSLPDGPYWVRVTLPDEREGFVRAEQIRSPTDYHACFAKIDDRWQMVRFARDITPSGRPK